MRGYLTRGKPLGVQGQHDLVHIVQPPLPFFDDDRLGRAVPVTRHLDGDGPHAVGRDRLDGGAVARVRAASPRAFLVLRASGMLGRLLVQSGLRHGPGELPERAVRPGRVEPPLLRPPYHLQRELPLGGTRPRPLAFPWFRRGSLAGGRFRRHDLHCLSRHAHHRPLSHRPRDRRSRPVTHFPRQSLQKCFLKSLGGYSFPRLFLQSSKSKELSTRTPIFSLGVPRTIPSYSGLQ